MQESLVHEHLGVVDETATDASILSVEGSYCSFEAIVVGLLGDSDHIHFVDGMEPSDAVVRGLQIQRDFNFILADLQLVVS